jgi:DNA-binding NtrC family response regulator
LFYRVNVISIELPPLRERISDIPQLANHFLHLIREEAGKQVDGFTDEAIEALRLHRWPGNVRELQNVVERAVLLGRNRTVGIEDLPATISAAAPSGVPRETGQKLKDALSGPERQIILEVLESNNWNRNVTASVLGINRTTLYKKMKRLGLDDSCRSALRAP